MYVKVFSFRHIFKKTRAFKIHTLLCEDLSMDVYNDLIVERDMKIGSLSLYAIDAFFPTLLPIICQVLLIMSVAFDIKWNG